MGACGPIQQTRVHFTFFLPFNCTFSAAPSTALLQLHWSNAISDDPHALGYFLLSFAIRRAQGFAHVSNGDSAIPPRDCAAGLFWSGAWDPSNNPRPPHRHGLHPASTAAPGHASVVCIGHSSCRERSCTYTVRAYWISPEHHRHTGSMPKQRRKRTRASKSRKQVAPEDERWYNIRGILDEREAKGCVEYLVDWDDNIDTGEAYSPTWSLDVTEAALEEWEKAKAGRDKGKEPEATPVEDSHAANERRVKKVNVLPLTRSTSATAEESNRPLKAPRLAYSATPSEEPVPSVTSRSSADSTEAFDSVPQIDPSDARLGQRLVIEFSKSSQFNAAEYLSAASTQTSGNSSQSLAELEDRDQRLAFASQISARTVPDSQEPSAPTWSQGHVSDPVLTPEDPAPDLEHPVVVSQSYSIPSNIPDHQPGQSDLLGTEDQDFPTAATGARSTSQPNTLNSAQLINSTAHSQPAGSSEFLTQPYIHHTFVVPPTSSQSMSPSHVAITATPTEESQPSTENRRPIEQGCIELQDAQIVRRDSFGSELDAFSGSHDTSHEQAAASSNSKTSSEERENTKLRNRQRGPSGDEEMEEGNSGDHPAPPESRMSAAEELSQLFNLDTSIIGPGATAPHTERQHGISVGSIQTAPSDQSQPSVVEPMQHMAHAAFGNNPPSRTLMSEAQDTQYSTVSPADISKQTAFERAALPLMPSLASQGVVSSNLYGSSAASVPMAQAPSEQSSSEASSDDAQDPGLMEHIVTLPFQASLRPFYDDTLLEYRRQVTQFGTVFNSEVCVEPDEALVKKIDQLFNRLHNICDYPQDAVGTSLEDLPPSQLAKYSCDANPKFNFVSELLQGLQKDTRVLIVARSVELLRLLYYLTETLEVQCICDAIGKPKSNFATSTARVTLGLPSEDINGLDFDVVVGFDHSFSRSPVSKGLSSKALDAKRPLVLILVTTHSIEHIDLHVPEDLGPLERKNALLSGIVRARKLMSDPDRGYPEPHQLANIFVEFLNGEVDNVIWEPVALPDDVLDIYVTSQSRSQMSTPERENGRKRKLDDSEDEDAKRMRILPLKESTVEANEPPMPDDIQEMLAGSTPAEAWIKSTQVQMKVSLAVLQALAEKHAEYKHQIAAKGIEAEYKAVISGLEQRVKEYERTTGKIYDSHRKALEDRSKFEVEKLKAEADLRGVADSTQRDNDKAQKRLAELEAAVARLTAGPDGSEETTPLAKSEKLLKEAQDKAQMLEKRLENAHKDGEYVRNLYQEASTSASAFRAENNELKEQNDDLQKKTSDSLARVHRIQAESETRQYLRQIRELKAQVREREIELDRARDELRQLKSGRRETRQASVPRSPRMGMMSPRPGRVYGGSASRGTSPAPATGLDVPAGMQFMSTQQPGNGRWNHLRD
ncbi:hypothetical protein TOPH_01666 [Tolypocladium ophioglossoides CBS 100239]|uniref:Chromo domain-containing protein n=1 Tax=Tolypocladium ophioglossoides (strain CBS 100239) TaxID=1163406 RepID=A0A0L0NI72_TOLOC|nr:hypothetical protein TOPH_01666 [Tolypocladium ophioglossoides CBS 100239]